MAIYALKGDVEKCELRAHKIRNTAITERRGALIVRKDVSETKPLLEKIIFADEFRPGEKTVAEIRWKPGCDVIFINDGLSRLKEFEALIPGFTAKFGPVSTVQL